MKNTLFKISLIAIASFVFIGTAFFVKAQSQAMPTGDAILVGSSDTDDIRIMRSGEMPMSMYGKGSFGSGNGSFGDGNGYFHSGRNDIMPMMREMAMLFTPAFIGLGIVFTIFGLILLAFWIWMLVHAIRHDIDYKPVWILVLWFLNIFGAIIYYFAVKKQCPCCMSFEEDVCFCENGKCACESVKEEVIEVKE